MSQVINTNVASLNAQRNLTTSQSSLATSLQRLSSGLRINSAKDDAAGLAITERMTAQIKGLDQARRNANDGVSVAQTAESALGQAGSLLQRIRELAVQSANDSNTSTDRGALQTEVSQLVAEYDRIATQTQFNGQNILDGTAASYSFQVGANANQSISMGISDQRSNTMGNRTATSNMLTGAGATGTYTLNSVSITGTATTAQGKAAEINALTAQHGVTASVSGNSAVGGAATTAANLSAGDVTINGVQVGAVTAGSDAATQLTAVAAAINTAMTNAGTGVTATVGTGTSGNGAATSAIILSNTSGAAITVALSGAATTAKTGLSAATTAANSNGTLTLSASLSGATVVSTEQAANALGFTTAAIAGTVTDNKLSAASVSTKASANTTINVIDAALSSINSTRATLGAAQNRFEVTISALSATSENLSAARSRTRDADFAAETANMTRSQILQQAGVAMLAQANALPNQVLSLLRG